MMGEQNYSKAQSQTVKFLEGIFRDQAPSRVDRRMALSAEPPIGKNQPEFWADIPWRIEPDQEALPLLFLVRDTNITSPAKGPWRLDVLKVEQRAPDGSWDTLLTFLPADLPKVDSTGNFQLRTWTYSTKVPLTGIQAANPGNTLHFRVVFHGSFFPYDKPAQIEIHLETLIAKHALPQSRAASKNQPRHWFYGDTHYHSIYTNDIKEIGNPIPETSTAAKAIGLDWLVITDHSCDLDDVDPDVSPLRRWDRLKTELTSPEISNEKFRCIQGEEITLVSGGENYVHMLAFGGMENMVEGAFLPDEGGFMTEVFHESIKKLLQKVARTGGYSDKETQRLFGKVHSFEDVLTMLPKQALIFAARPFQIAQPPPPGIWTTENLYHPRLTGFEFWNGRSRSSTQLTINPFACSSWQNPEEQVKRDQARIKKLIDWSESKWDLALRRGLAGWADTDELPSLRPVFLAGTDAHGSFNYSVGLSWDYRSRLIVDDNALGKVRTVIYTLSPFTDAVPTEEEILATIRKGSCVVTDGPIIEFSIENDGNIAHMGEVLDIAGSKDITINVQAFTTPEFGSVEQVELYTCFRHVRRPTKTTIKKGCTQLIPMDGTQGYCRLFAQSVSGNGELFCCFTNPVWIRCKDQQKHTLIVSYE
jgi:hypothetical protein